MNNCKVIKTDAEYQSALSDIDTILKIADPSQDQLERLELLSVLVEDYEKINCPVGLPDPIEAIKFRMEQEGLSKKDMQKYIGSASKVSEVLNRKKPLTLSMMRALHDGLGIPAEVLMQEPGKSLPPCVHKIDKYPFNEMFKRNYFDFWNTSLTLSKAKEFAEELLNQFFEGFPIGKQIYCKKTGNNDIDINALTAWQCRIFNRLKNVCLPIFRKETLTLDFINSVARLSYYEKGSLLVIEHLNKIGIHVVIEPHLPKTHLDGAAFMLPDGHPVIALTFRHDRLDNFWFTLLHELAHVKEHLNGCRQSFFDDIDGQTRISADKKEQEANRIAEEALIPNSIWHKEKNTLLTTHNVDKLVDFANRNQVAVAVIAGRIRWERQCFTVFSDQLGHVKYLFSNQ